VFSGDMDPRQCPTPNMSTHQQSPWY
jgi:hypothetical protein